MVEPSFELGLLKSQSNAFLLLGIQIKKQICSETREKVAVSLFYPKILGFKTSYPGLLKFVLNYIINHRSTRD